MDFFLHFVPPLTQGSTCIFSLFLRFLNIFDLTFCFSEKKWLGAGCPSGNLSSLQT